MLMREKVNGFVGVMAVAILCMVSGLCMVWGIAPVVLAVYVAACAVCGTSCGKNAGQYVLVLRVSVHHSACPADNSGISSAGVADSLHDV